MNYLTILKLNASIWVRVKCRFGRQLARFEWLNKFIGIFYYFVLKMSLEVDEKTAQKILTNDFSRELEDVKWACQVISSLLKWSLSSHHNHRNTSQRDILRVRWLPLPQPCSTSQEIHNRKTMKTRTTTTTISPTISI